MGSCKNCGIIILHILGLLSKTLAKKFASRCFEMYWIKMQYEMFVSDSII